MIFFSRLFILLSLNGFLFPGLVQTALAAPPERKAPKELPGVETKIRQVPGDSTRAFPLWKQHWEKARQSVILKKYPEAVQDFQKALALKPNLDEARQELVQVLVTLERWGEAVKELEILAEHHPQNIKVQKELAGLLSQKKEYRRAIEKYNWLLQHEPENLSLRLSLATNYYQIGESEKAMIEWRQVLIRDPQNLEARTHLAEVLMATRRLDESIQILEGLVKQNPKQYGLKKKLAQALVQAHRNKEALPYLQELVRQDPGEMEVQLLLAQVLSAGKHYDQSLTYLDTYLKKKPESSSALLEKARVLFNTGNHAEALEVFKKLKALEPQNRDLQRELAEAYFISGRSREALSEYEALAKYFPQDFQIQERIGDLYAQNKNYRKAIVAYQKACSLEPENIFLQIKLARAYNFSGDKEKALPLYRAILAKRNDINLQTEMGELLVAARQYSEALQVYQRILEPYPQSWDTRLKLAALLYHQKAFDQAARELEILVQKDPDNPEVWSLMGSNAMELGDYPQAQKALQKALTLGHDPGLVLVGLGTVLRLQGRPWQGIQYLDWALTLKPGSQEILVEKAMSLIDGGNLAQAMRILEPMNTGPSGDFRVQRTWYRLLAAQERGDESQAGWETLERNFPSEQSLILQDRADFYLHRKKANPALAALKAAEIKNQNNLEIKRRTGRLLIRMGQWEEAEDFYKGLEGKKVLLDEVYFFRAARLIRQKNENQAKELLWKALTLNPDSIDIRFLLWVIYNREGSGQSAKIEEALRTFSRSEQGGQLKLADNYKDNGDLGKASSAYLDLIDRGEDDDVLTAARRISEYFPESGKRESLQTILEDLQKRFPRNQKISRLLLDSYIQRKEYALAVKTIDGLLRIEDPSDPILNTRKARILERWNKHFDSQDVYKKMLTPPIDDKFRAKVSEFIPQGTITAHRHPSENDQVGSINPFYEEASLKIDSLSLSDIQKQRLSALIKEYSAPAIIQKKVYLEKEGKDRLWRNQFMEARPFLNALKKIDPDNEDLAQDISKSYQGRIQD
jgi:tetratricopeptide (TPR) repeat protein